VGAEVRHRRNPYLSLKDIYDERPPISEMLWNRIDEEEYETDRYKEITLDPAEVVWWPSRPGSRDPIIEAREHYATDEQKEIVDWYRGGGLPDAREGHLVVDLERKFLLDGWHRLVALAQENVGEVKALDISDWLGREATNPPGPARDDGRYVFVTDCIRSTYEDISALNDDSTKISMRTFRRKLAPGQWRELSARLGYDRWLPLSKDPLVGFFRSTYRGVPAVYLAWSGIEQIFTLDGRQGPSLARNPQTPRDARPCECWVGQDRRSMNPGGDEAGRRLEREGEGMSFEDEVSLLARRVRSGQTPLRNVELATTLNGHASEVAATLLDRTVGEDDGLTESHLQALGPQLALPLVYDLVHEAVSTARKGPAAADPSRPLLTGWEPYLARAHALIHEGVASGPRCSDLPAPGRNDTNFGDDARRAWQDARHAVVYICSAAEIARFPASERWRGYAFAAVQYASSLVLNLARSHGYPRPNFEVEARALQHRWDQAAEARVADLLLWGPR
jgi:hypothetical protein